ncbi:hypothetical protein HZA40_03350 [Candidatus Peregrinibacteria bacterium]|nr:hypothetical protein [Candidatus Peregrinibacteria bacterium]
MTIFTALMILIMIGSTTVCLLTAWRVFHYNSKYHLPESQYTRLFGILNKEHFMFFYIIFVVLNIFAGVWFILTI